MRKMIFVLACILLLNLQTQAQTNKAKKLNRQKWKELVNEVNSKRYDKAEKQTKYSESPETEYSRHESEMYEGEGDGTGSGGSGNGNGGGNGGGGGGEYENYTDDGIYDGSATDDRDFFDEENDRGGTGTGNDPFNEGPGGEGGSNSDFDRKYGDDNQPSNTRDSKEQEQRIYRDTPPPVKETRAASSSSAGGDSTWLIVVLIVLVAAAVVYMIIVSFSDKKKVKPVVVSNEERFENMTITKSELELALEAALANGNYREAVRIYFIAIIKEMKDHSWIKWEKKKTNYHYINEISGRKQQPDFITATRAFETVWYGNRSLGENDYRQIEPHFKKLLTSINA